MSQPLPARSKCSDFLLPLATLATVLSLSACSILPGMRNQIDSADANDKPIPGLEVVPLTAEVLFAEALKSAAATRAAGLQTVPESSDPYVYRIGTGDVIRVVIWEHPELNNPSGQAQGDSASSGRIIEPDGTMFFPYIGTIKAAGLTTSELRQKIAGPLAKFIREPQIDIRVTEFRSQRIYVTGEVNQPGPLFLTDTPVGALDVIASKGGFTELSNRNRVQLTRDGVVTQLYFGDLERGDARANVRLKAGDLLNVPDISNDKIFLLGEFNTQKTIVRGRSEISLAEALTQGGGLDKIGANAAAIFIFRRRELPAAPTPDTDTGEQKDPLAAQLLPKVFALDLTRAESLLLAERFPLQARDVVYVSATDFSKYNRVLGQLLPTVSTYFQLDRLINN